jgi:hypothetical protein
MVQRRIVLLLFILASAATVIVQCTQITESKDSRGPAYAGSTTCQNCHKGISDSYIHNAHFNTSKFLSRSNSTDSLGLPPGEFVFNKKTKVGIEKRDSGLFQIAYVNGTAAKAERTDFVFGAGLSAYTFAYWYGNKLMQMPLNYLTREHQWVNSPGFPTEQIYFGRPIIARCLECHSSYVEKKLIQTNDLNLEEEFVKGSLIAGIDCERCHGPAAKHVEFHKENPAVKKAVEMVSYKSLPLARRIDMCGVCHSGAELQTLKSTFAFKPGDTLKSLPQYSEFTGKEPDVHGNQKQLLEASACYKIGKAECASCHDVHSTTKANFQIYAKKCLSCHQDPKHEHLKVKDQALLINSCIDCHMPAKESNAIGFQVSNSKDKIPYKVRTHRIAVYEEVIKEK